MEGTKLKMQERWRERDKSVLETCLHLLNFDKKKSRRCDEEREKERERGDLSEMTSNSRRIYFHPFLMRFVATAIRGQLLLFSLLFCFKAILLIWGF